MMLDIHIGIGWRGAFNSLSRDHWEVDPETGVERFIAFQLPLSGSRASDVGRCQRDRPLRLSTPSLGITRGIEKRHF